MPIPLIAKLGIGAATIGGLWWASSQAKAAAPKPSGTAPTGSDPKLAAAKGLADGKAAGEFDFTNGSPKGTTGPSASAATASGSPEDYKRSFAVGYTAGYDGAKLAAGGAKAIDDVIGKFGMPPAEVDKAAEGDSKSGAANIAYAKKANDQGRVAGQIDGTRDGGEFPLDSASAPNCQPGTGQTSFYRTNFCYGYMDAYGYYFAKAQAYKREKLGSVVEETAEETWGEAEYPGSGFGTDEESTDGYARTGRNTHVGQTVYSSQPAGTESFGPVYRRQQSGTESVNIVGRRSIDMGRVKQEIDAGRMPVEKARALATAMAHHGQYDQAKAFKAYYWRAQQNRASGNEEAMHTGAMYETMQAKLPPWFRRSPAAQAQTLDECYNAGVSAGRADAKAGKAGDIQDAFRLAIPGIRLRPITGACLDSFTNGYRKGYATGQRMRLPVAFGQRIEPILAPGMAKVAPSKPSPAIQAQQRIGMEKRCYDNGFAYGRDDAKNGRPQNSSSAVDRYWAKQRVFLQAPTAAERMACSLAIAEGYKKGYESGLRMRSTTPIATPTGFELPRPRAEESLPGQPMSSIPQRRY